MLIEQAQVDSAVLVTKDSTIPRYPIATLW
jgi:PIN domain nuclease of toxin-antitoxin system